MRPSSLVTTQTSGTLSHTDQPFILVLKKGEELMEGILDCAMALGIKGATLTGLGAIKNVFLAYYHLDIQQYQTKFFEDSHELISLNGNISLIDEKPFLHIHAAIGKPDYSVIGGHVMSATVAVTAEIAIVPLKAPIHREFDVDVGLNLLCPCDQVTRHS